MWKKWVEIERGAYTEKGQEEDCRFRISKKDMNRIDNSWKEEIGGKEIEGEKRKRGYVYGQKISVDSVSREEDSVNREKERNFN